MTTSGKRRMAKACREAYQHGLEQCAAGPWQPMETAPRTKEEILLQLKDGRIIMTSYDTFFRCYRDRRVRPPQIISNEKIIAWARINTQEEENETVPRRTLL